jgi:hypothetical protein
MDKIVYFSVRPYKPYKLKGLVVVWLISETSK